MGAICTMSFECEEYEQNDQKEKKDSGKGNANDSHGLVCKTG